MKKPISIIIIIISCILITTSEMAYATTPRLNKTKLGLIVGEVYTLKLTEASGSIKWASSNKSIVIVSSKGKVSAIACGKATVVATTKNRRYICTVIISDPEVNLIFGAVIFDDGTIEEYAVDFKKSNPKYIEVKAYDRDHIIVTLLESNRLKYIKEFNECFDEILSTLVSDNNANGVIIKLEADKSFTEVSIYVDPSKCENQLSYFSIYMVSAVVSDMFQAYSFIDINDRKCDIVIINNFSGAIIYPEE